MTHEDWAAPWPFLSRIAAMKATSREGRRGRYSGLDDLERLAALRHMRGGPASVAHSEAEAARSAAAAGAGAAATYGRPC